MNAISKPHIVDLLRIFDRRRYICPRIRYASVRSKPELIRDISRHFAMSVQADVVTLKPLKTLCEVPVIRYHLKEKHYSFDGNPVDVPRQSREKVRFQISRKPVTIHWPVILAPPQSGPPSTRRGSVSSLESQERDTDTLSESSWQSAPFVGFDSTPTSGFAYHLS